MKDAPHRTCIGCRQVKPKQELIRLVRGADGETVVDAHGTAPGRGAYTCPTARCMEQALAPGRLARALKGAVKPPRESAAAIVEFWARR